MHNNFLPSPLDSQSSEPDVVEVGISGMLDEHTNLRTRRNAIPKDQKERKEGRGQKAVPSSLVLKKAEAENPGGSSIKANLHIATIKDRKEDKGSPPFATEKLAGQRRRATQG